MVKIVSLGLGHVKKLIHFQKCISQNWTQNACRMLRGQDKHVFLFCTKNLLLKASLSNFSLVLGYFWYGLFRKLKLRLTETGLGSILSVNSDGPKKLAKIT